MQDRLSDRLIGEGRRFLDQIYERFPRDPQGISNTMATLLQGLHQIRREMRRDEWKRFCRDVVPKHGLAGLIRQDPFTLHSVRKPRGYAGDALLLDYIYGLRDAATTRVGKRIFDFTTSTPPCRAVRKRAAIIAGIIDRVAQDRGPLRLLSIACGHLREAEMSRAMRYGKIAEYVAYDQDAESLAHVRERFVDRNVRTIHGSIGELLLGKHRDLGGFDFVYAAGLYDYLSQKLATRLTTWMFKATRPGGITLLTNFLPETAGAGYMEAFMQWELIFRSPEELLDTAGRIPREQIENMRSYTEDDGNVVFVELEKAKQPLPAIQTTHRPVLPRRNGLPTPPRNGQMIRS